MFTLTTAVLQGFLVNAMRWEKDIRILKNEILLTDNDYVSRESKYIYNPLEFLNEYSKIVICITNM